MSVTKEREKIVSLWNKKKEQLMSVIEQQQQRDIHELVGAICNLKSTLDERKTKRTKYDFVSPINLDEAHVPSEEQHIPKRQARWKTPVKRNAFRTEKNDLLSTIGSSQVLCYSQRCKVEYNNQGEAEVVQDLNNAKDKNVSNNNMYVCTRNHPRLRFKSCVIQTPFAGYGPKKKMIPK